MESYMGEHAIDTYIKKRKRKASLVGLCYRMARIFPVNKKKVVLFTFEGSGGYTCSPRYIAEELLRKYPHYQLVWLVNDLSKVFPEGIYKVENTFINRVYHLATAKVWIANSRTEYGTKKRKGQFYLQTWHGEMGFKAVGKYRGDKLPTIAELVSMDDSNKIDVVLCNSKFGIELYPDMLMFKGPILKTGLPRCDVFQNRRNEIYRKIREYYQVPQDGKIMIYAPTFRGGGQENKREINAQGSSLDYDRMLGALKKKFGGEWYLFLRLHPQLAAKMKDMPIDNKSNYIIDVSQGDDMCELSAAADAFITDYSSAACDAMLARIPVFLYADDIDEYLAERGEFTCDIYNHVFPLAETNEQLEKNILEFDKEKFYEALEAFIVDYEMVVDGKATERVVKMVVEKS